jgi:hypothetical protein
MVLPGGQTGVAIVYVEIWVTTGIGGHRYYYRAFVTCGLIQIVLEHIFINLICLGIIIEQVYQVSVGNEAVPELIKSAIRPSVSFISLSIDTKDECALSCLFS